ADFRAWPKTLSDFVFGKSRLAGIWQRHPTMAAVDPFRPGRFIILRGCGRGEPGQRCAVVPGHPLRWMPLQFRGVSLQLGEIVKWIRAIQLTRVDPTHEQVTDPGAVQ